MNKTRRILTIPTMFVLILTSALMAQAQTNRAHVAAVTGNDANAATNCTQANPCKTFNAALPIVNNNGSIVALESGGYGGLSNVNKPITVEAVPGVRAFTVVVAGATGIIVNAGASDVVRFRNLSITGVGAAGTTGIQINSGRVIIENTTFSNLTTGINNINSKTSVIECELYANTTAIRSDGQGLDPQNSQADGGTTQLRIFKGNIVNNGTAFAMVNPGTRPCMGCDNRVNILIFNNQGGVQTNIIGNATYLSGSGTGCGMSLCQQLGSYQSQVSNNLP